MEFGLSGETGLNTLQHFSCSELTSEHERNEEMSATLTNGTIHFTFGLFVESSRTTTGSDRSAGRGSLQSDSLIDETKQLLQASPRINVASIKLHT